MPRSFTIVLNQTGCPRVRRTDCGTENVAMAAMQCYFRGNGNDDQAGLNAYRYGSSSGKPAHRRMVVILTAYRSTWWINFFKDLVETNIVDTVSELSMSCLWFCFKDILHADLDHERITGTPITFENTSRYNPFSHLRPGFARKCENCEFCEKSQKS